MSCLRRFILRFRSTFQRTKFENGMDEELHFHIESMIQDNVKAGMTPEEARRVALLSFGGFDKTKEDCRDTRRLKPLEDLWQDLRYGIRVLVKNPGFTALSVLMLAVALGASAVTFSIINSVLLLPLPYRDSDRLVRCYSTSKESNKDDVSPADFVDWKHQASSFEGITAFSFALNAPLSGDRYPEEIRVMSVTSDFFTVFGPQAALGRVFREEDCDPDANLPFVMSTKGATAVLSHGLWQRRFGGSPSIVGDTITINGGPYTVVGVLPAGFHFSDGPGKPDVDCWLPQAYRENENPKAHMLTVVGKLKPGTSLGKAKAEMDVIARSLAEKRPAPNEGRGVQLVSLHETVVGEVRTQLLILFFAVLFVVITAGANIANLLLARAVGRRREMAVRTAIGASRSRLIRQLVAESTSLCVIGGMLGFLFATYCEKSILAFAPPNLPRVNEIGIDYRTFCFSFIAAVLTGALCGAVPAIRASRADLTEALKAGALIPRIRGRVWIGNGLVTAQIALTLVLLIGTGLMVRTFAYLHAVPLGFDPQNLIS